jgi:hypothetical protein
VPVRAPYDSTPGFQIGVNHLTADEPLWYSLSDVVAAALLGDQPPHVVRAFRLDPVGQQPGLTSLRLRGTVPVDPRTEDFFRVVVEERVRVLRGAAARSVESGRLAAFLKVVASATSYGIFAQLDPEPPTGSRVPVVVQGLDGPFETKVPRPELPGEFYFPPLAAVITGAARLMLALLERQVVDAGGTWAFCDTDSMAIVASRDGAAIPGLPRRVLTGAEVEAIREGFAALNPYDRTAIPGSILKLEDENMADGVERDLWCFAISAKRYALFTLDEAGEPELVKWSEHGLGHLLNPTDPDSDDRTWIRQVWEMLVREALGLPVEEPAWLARAAVGRISVSSAALLARFDRFNAGKSYADQMKPFNFLLTAHVRPFGHPFGVDPTRFQLIAPYTSDAQQWTKLAWIDRDLGRTYRITTAGDTGGPGVARVKSYRDVLAEYRVHPEAKSAGPDGEPCGVTTTGLVGRRQIVAGRIRYVGKESNRLEDVDGGLVHDADEVSTEYVDPRRDLWVSETLPSLRLRSTAAIARELKVNVSTVKRWKAGRMRRRATRSSDSPRRL